MRGKATILHDWDSATLSGRKALRRGVALVVYALSKWVSWLNWWGRVKRSNRAIDRERLYYMQTLIRLDELLGEVPIFGIRGEVLDKHPEEILRLVKEYDVELRQHLHIGSPPDPTRERLWVPPLIQSMKSWTFERDYIAGRGELEEGDLPIFHVDNPENLRHYIAYLYEERKK